MGWNEVESRFDAPQHFWNELKRKEQRYWKEHRVLSAHLATAAWLGNEVANGNDSSHPSDAIHDDAFANPILLEELHDLEVEQEETVSYDQTSVPSTPVESMSRTRGRPRSNASTSREKKKKTGAEKIGSPLKLIASIISGLIQSDPLTDLGKKLNSAIDAIPGLDFQKCFRAKQFLLRNRDSAILFLEAKEEDKMKVLEMVLPDGVANQ
ncbi:uncharacterized protein LOC122084785 [Macadamia integrifolia]|uniref:uncharacterized protein LOC122084785 n=1 Tax=Macadamia integrifolia TaxID=60698 RepID=UPI001C4F861B|nr:uncharacterized protein LOC122084785 [Macadamia integrifolia]